MPVSFGRSTLPAAWAISRPFPSCSPSEASWRSNAMTGRLPRRAPTKRWRSFVKGSSTTTGRAPWSTPGQLGWRCTGVTPRRARQLVALAARLRPLLSYALPVVSIQALLEMAEAYLGLADSGGARAVLRQADDIFQQRPALGNLQTHATELRADGSLRPSPRAGSVVAHDRRAAPAPAVTDASLLPRDRRAPLHLPSHGEDPGDLDLPQARRVVAQRDDRADVRARPARARLTHCAGRSGPDQEAGTRFPVRQRESAGTSTQAATGRFL